MHKEYSMAQRRRNVQMRILLIVLAALLILGVGLLVIRLTGTGASLQNQQTHLFQVGAHPLVTVSGAPQIQRSSILERIYTPLMRWVTKHRVITVSLAFLFLKGSSGRVAN